MFEEEFYFDRKKNGESLPDTEKEEVLSLVYIERDM